MLRPETTTPPPSKRICCQPNMEVNDCYNPCDVSKLCPQLRPKTPLFCPAICRPDVCECKKGLMLNECGECVNPWECKSKCKKAVPVSCRGVNEMYYGCLEEWKSCENRPRKCQCKNCKCSPCRCGQTKTSSKKKLCRVASCDCKPNFYRNKYGICVTEHECDYPRRPSLKTPCSDPNEKRYETWTRYFERSCWNRMVKPRKRTPENLKKYYHVCDCKKDYLRDDCDRCVLKAKCFVGTPCSCTNPCKNVNQTWTVFNGCSQRTCHFYHVAPYTTCQIEGNYGCDCNEGLYLNESTNICVPSQECPPLANSTPTD